MFFSFWVFSFTAGDVRNGRRRTLSRNFASLSQDRNGDVITIQIRCNSKTCSQKSTQISAYIIGKSTSHTRPLLTDHSLDRGLDIALQSNIKCKRVKGDILPDTSPLTAINDKLVITAKISPKKIPPSSLQQNGTIISKPYVKRLQIQLLRLKKKAF